MNLVRFADRPDLLEIRFATLAGVTFPEYMHNNVPGNKYWGRLYEDHPDFQLALLDGPELVAELHSVPTAWDGSDEDLPSGWDEAFLRAFEAGREADVLCALAISVRPDRQGERLSSRMLDAMREAAGSHGLRELIAPVRPTRKSLYPLVPIERYVEWRRPDGAHFDPWIRLHERIGGTILATAPESMVMEAPVSDWEEWTGMKLPEDGDYVFPGALAPLHVRGGVGRHVEPNVWLRHVPLGGEADEAA
jgi:GNAT superfamily N-acetyltransferase